jgi:hypothetical protein
MRIPQFSPEQNRDTSPNSKNNAEKTYPTDEQLKDFMLYNESGKRNELDFLRRIRKVREIGQNNQQQQEEQEQPSQATTQDPRVKLKNTTFGTFLNRLLRKKQNTEPSKSTNLDLTPEEYKKIQTLIAAIKNQQAHLTDIEEQMQSLLNSKPPEDELTEKSEPLMAAYKGGAQKISLLTREIKNIKRRAVQAAADAAEENLRATDPGYDKGLKDEDTLIRRLISKSNSMQTPLSGTEGSAKQSESEHEQSETISQ